MDVCVEGGSVEQRDVTVLMDLGTTPRRVKQCATSAIENVRLKKIVRDSDTKLVGSEEIIPLPQVKSLVVLSLGEQRRNMLQEYDPAEEVAVMEPKFEILEYLSGINTETIALIKLAQLIFNRDCNWVKHDPFENEEVCRKTISDLQTNLEQGGYKPGL